MQQYLQPTTFIDFDSNEVASYAEEKPAVPMTLKSRP
jgi:hypothetical protein